jgi:hypothetical protein
MAFVEELFKTLNIFFYFVLFSVPFISTFFNFVTLLSRVSGFYRKLSVAQKWPYRFLKTNDFGKNGSRKTRLAVPRSLNS